MRLYKKKELGVSSLSEKLDFPVLCREPQTIPAEDVMIPSCGGPQKSKSSIECLSTCKPFRHQGATHPIPTVLPAPRGLCRAAAEAAAHAAVAQSSAGGAVPKAPLFSRQCWSSTTSCARATVCLSCLLPPADVHCVTCRQLLPLGKDRGCVEENGQREQDLPSVREAPCSRGRPRQGIAGPTRGTWLASRSCGYRLGGMRT